MDFVRFEGTLEKHVFETTLIAKITAKVLEIPSHATMKYDLQLTMFLANVIENELGDKKTDSEKHALVKTILQPIFNLDADDIGIIQNQLHFLKDNKKIKQLTTSKYLYRAVGGWFTRHIL
jgi:hypothetical protein